MAAPPQLEQIIRDELRAPVAELVRQVVVELVHEQLNGAGPAPEIIVSGPENAKEPRRRPGPIPKPAPAERRCNRCKETKSAGEYAPGRGTCRSCRRAQQREHDRRVALADDEEPHPAPSRSGSRYRLRGAVFTRLEAERRALIEEAGQNGVTHEMINGRTFTVLHLAPGAVEPPPLRP